MGAKLTYFKKKDKKRLDEIWKLANEMSEITGTPVPSSFHSCFKSRCDSFSFSPQLEMMLLEIDEFEPISKDEFCAKVEEVLKREKVKLKEAREMIESAWRFFDMMVNAE